MTLRILVAALLSVASWNVWAAPVPQEMDVKLICELQACDNTDSLFLFQFNGLSFLRMDAKPLVEGQAVFQIKTSAPRFFYVGTNPNNLKPLILGEEAEVKVTGQCQMLRSATVAYSPLNTRYEELKNTLNEFKSTDAKLVQEFQQVMRNPAEKARVVAEMGKVDAQKKAFLESVQKEHPLLGDVVALNTYLTFHNNGGSYDNEILYFANEFFQQVDWTSPNLEHNPWVYESWKSYVETLSRVGLDNESHKGLIQSNLELIPANSSARRLALSGILAGLQQANHPNYIEFGKEYVMRYQKEDPLAAQSVQQRMVNMRAFVTGGEAPDFAQATPEGESLSLSALRGKVVLIDFWASWCGPCRRENPNVVKMYNQYKDKGFDILGVSLDRDRARWVDAIEKDGLTWHHVSDLQGWKNEVAQLYGVRSIPHTVLLDQEGKIIARNLRGPTLEAKLKELFGE